MEDLNNVSAALRTLLDLCGDGGCLIDPAEWRVVYANAALLEWINQHSAIPPAETLFAWLPDLQNAEVEEQLSRVIAGEIEEAAFISHLANDSAGARPAEVRVRRVDSSDGALLAIAITQPVAVASADEQSAARHTDPLTGLADRAFFQERLSTRLHGDRASDHHCAVLFIDVDGFKQINDAFGHLVGDRVLREVARRLAGCVRADDHVARFGGDEFVVLLERVRGPEEIELVAERIRAAFERPIALPQGEVKLAVSVGAAEAGPHDRSVEELIHAADRAMYAAKRAVT
jgi:diguanylate cyclase (GGDEF)-like protein